ncbi:sensor histidine kinase [Actinospica sp. MGRD01-02]|uniref:Sensor histidine kinase n=1 Tax=Actinospica acidithermotolerans TaxID=2828514 RepID=A0A941ECU6_9ACTN|nr:anti-sigma factor RsbA family regulatory protein [Actinospica acidithermotolerans]MBR7828040.1 sensor histidine kinase [Actinospica acidithermotolerans]
MASTPSRFRHEALLYEGLAGFVAETSSFVREGLRAGEAVMVAAVAEHAGPLREELGEAAGVEYLDMDSVGRNPARIIPAWRDWVERNTVRGTACRGVGELAWPGRSELELRECRVHEHLVNPAFEAGPPWRLLCPYDAALPEPVLAGVTASHPELRGCAPPAACGRFDPDGGTACFDAPLPRLGPPLYRTDFGLDELPLLRAEIRRRAAGLGLHGERLADFVLVADELAGNSVRHGGGGGSLAVWGCARHAVCEVRDEGVIRDPLVGRRRPDLRSANGGAGLWSVNQLCDLLIIHSTGPGGTAVRAYLDTGSPEQAHVPSLNG